MAVAELQEAQQRPAGLLVVVAEVEGQGLELDGRVSWQCPLRCAVGSEFFREEERHIERMRTLATVQTFTTLCISLVMRYIVRLTTCRYWIISLSLVIHTCVVLSISIFQKLEHAQKDNLCSNAWSTKDQDDHVAV